MCNVCIAYKLKTFLCVGCAAGILLTKLRLLIKIVFRPGVIASEKIISAKKNIFGLPVVRKSVFKT